MTKCRRKASHGKPQIGKLKEFEGKLSFDVDGKVEQAMVEVVAFAIALHDVCEFGIINVVNLWQSTFVYHTKSRKECMHTGSRVSGDTSHRSNQVMYARPIVPSGKDASLARSTVFVLILGLSFKILRPS